MANRFEKRNEVVRSLVSLCENTASTEAIRAFAAHGVKIICYDAVVGLELSNEEEMRSQMKAAIDKFLQRRGIQ